VLLVHPVIGADLRKAGLDRPPWTKKVDPKDLGESGESELVVLLIIGGNGDLQDDLFTCRDRLGRADNLQFESRFWRCASGSGHSGHCDETKSDNQN